jgi:hypothetical protein
MKRLFAVLSLIVFFCSGVYAVSGVSPSSYEIDFEPGLEMDFNFEFVIEGIRIVDLSVGGDLAEYVTLDTEKVAANQKIVASMKLPDSLDKPGINEIRVRAGEVVGVILVNVPYPEKFVELDLSAPDTNEGEIIEIKLDLFNKGNDVTASPRLEFYKIEDGEEKIANVMSLNKTYLTDKYTYDLKIVPGSYSAGDYVVVANVEYDGFSSKVNNSFRVGERRVEILNYTKRVKEGRVNRFNLEVLSFWNSDIEGLYMDVSLLGTDKGFVSSGVELDKWEKTNLLGFLDTKGIRAGEHNLEVIVYFDGDSVTEILPIEVYEGFDLIFVLVIIGSLISIIVVFWMWIRFRKSMLNIE